MLLASASKPNSDHKHVVNSYFGLYSFAVGSFRYFGGSDWDISARSKCWNSRVTDHQSRQHSSKHPNLAPICHRQFLSYLQDICSTYLVLNLIVKYFDLILRKMFWANFWENQIITPERQLLLPGTFCLDDLDLGHHLLRCFVVVGGWWVGDVILDSAPGVPLRDCGWWASPPPLSGECKHLLTNYRAIKSVTS